MFPAAWVMFGLLAAIQGYVFSAVEGQPTSLGVAALRQIPMWWTWALFTPAILWLGEHVPITRDRRIAPAVIHVAAGLATAVAHSLLAITLFTVLFPTMLGQQAFGELFITFLSGRVHFSVLMYWGILGMGYAFSYYQEMRRRQLVATQLEGQLARAHLQALRMQLHPHFLFNALHAISVLVKENPDAAERMITKLGDLLRLTLDTSTVQEVTLEEELEFLRLYLEIEQIRFHDRLSVDYHISDDTLDALVPIFLLQPVVENAIKHGIAERAGAGRIDVGAGRQDGQLRIWVRNDGPSRSVPEARQWRDGIGLGTTRERLSRMYGALASIDIQPGTASVQVDLMLPWRTHSSSPGQALHE